MTAMTATKACTSGIDFSFPGCIRRRCGNEIKAVAQRVDIETSGATQAYRKALEIIDKIYRLFQSLTFKSDYHSGAARRVEYY
jgi:hypothetical protein